MKKALTWSLLAAFSWLQLYQICDASEDMIEYMSARVDTLSKAGASLHTPAAPDDDPDTNIPFVAAEVLDHRPVQIQPDLTAFGLVPLPLNSPEATLVLAADPSRAPPGYRLTAAVPLLSALILDRSPARSLAPPQA